MLQVIFESLACIIHEALHDISYAQYFGCVQLKGPVEKGDVFLIAQKCQWSRVFIHWLDIKDEFTQYKRKQLKFSLNALLSKKITFLTFDIFRLLKTHPFLH